MFTGNKGASPFILFQDHNVIVFGNVFSNLLYLYPSRHTTSFQCLHDVVCLPGWYIISIASLYIYFVALF